MSNTSNTNGQGKSTLLLTKRERSEKQKLKEKQDKKNRKKTPLTQEEIRGFRISDAHYIILKWVAILTMFIDHTAIFLARYKLLFNANLYNTLHGIGRIAFPLFAFLLVESYYYTNDKKRHFKRLVLLAFISELPFDMFVEMTPLRTSIPHIFESQNVCFTLALGFLLIWICDALPIEKLVGFGSKKEKNNEKIVRLVRSIIRADLCMTFAVIVWFIKADWNWYGLVFIWLLDEARRHKKRVKWTIISELILFSCYLTDLTDMWSKSVTIIPFCVFLTLPFIISAIRSNQRAVNAQEKSTSKMPKFLNSKPYMIISHYFYPLHLLILGGLANFILALFVE